MFSLKGLSRYKEIGFLLLRIGIGCIFIAHGLPKLMGGAEVWKRLGSTMEYLHIDFGFVFWGFLGAVSESLGGLFFMLGLCFRQTCFFLAFTMFVAFFFHFSSGGDFKDYSHSLLAFFIFFSFIFIGPGQMSVQKN